MTKRKWQYGLRELLLGVLATAVVLGLAARYGPELVAEIRLRQQIWQAQRWLSTNQPAGSGWSVNSEAGATQPSGSTSVTILAPSRHEPASPQP